MQKQSQGIGVRTGYHSDHLVRTACVNSVANEYDRILVYHYFNNSNMKLHSSPSS